MVSVVQLARAPDCDSGNRGFESRRIPFPKGAKGENIERKRGIVLWFCYRLLIYLAR